MVVSCAIRFSIEEYYVQPTDCVFVFSFLYSINELHIIEIVCVHCAVLTESVNIIRLIVVFKGLM
jgi:hypothetical protein